AVAEKALQRLQEGKKPLIAFASTMGSFIETMENEQGMPVSEGDTINADFSEVLKRGLEGVLRYTEKDVNGQPIHQKFSISDFTADAQAEYSRIQEKINTVSTGITISPIDVIIKRIQQAGYSVAEVTGRKYELQLNGKGSKGLVMSRKRINTNDAFRRFNNNEVDVLMINQSGSTGASAHAVPTAKVPKEQVKQRVMIVLQAELDISTEVQKRGRINRTGQILQPVYDYLVSAIPAEKRLMMMLQKKLKSLDANTTSNQKQSSKILDVPDFLNKYGDKIVKEYLVENPAVNKLLDDPLYLERSGSDSGGREGDVLEEAAMKVSGRVAVLSTKMQEDFYNEIAQRYDDYVEYLRQIGEYDLEVEAMNLEAETISSRVIKMGKGGDSAFGNDSALETVRANVLKKPFTVTELENLLTEALKGSDATRLQEELLAGYQSSIGGRLEEERAEVHAKYDELIKEIPQEKKIKRIQEKQGDQAWLKAVAERKTELNAARGAQLQNLEKIMVNRRGYLERIFKFFFVGRFLNYPVETYQSGNELVPAAFLGFMIDPKKKNPYAPSAIKLRYAIANSSKYLAIPASYSESINAIIGVSADVAQPELPSLLRAWENYTKDNNVDRRIRHIITGNLLQAFSDGKGKLVSYTTLDGQVKKGILLPEHWDAGEEVQDKVIVPVLKALPIIKSLVDGKNIVTNNGVVLIRTGNYFKIIVPASRVRGGDVYLDKQILALVEKNNFEKVSDKMVAMLPERNIDQFIELLQVNHGSSITIHSSDTKNIKTDSSHYSNRKPIEMPPPEEETARKPANIRLLELEAEALVLELELLAAA
ncbi:MAG TPA: strawberry notch C-terminal domain-containing protein, partial [Puia sp.]